MVGKKGSILDFAIIIPYVLVVALCLIVTFMIWSTYVANIPGEFTTTEINETYDRVTATYQSMDYIMTFFIFGLCFVVIFFAFAVRSHPIFFFFSFIVLAIIVFVSILVSNVFGQIVGDALLVGYASQFPVLVTLMTNLPTIILVMATIVIIVQYTRGEDSV